MSDQAIKQMNEVFRVFSASDGVIRPHFILTGPSGSGKSFNVLNMADAHNLNYHEINAAQLTKEGLSFKPHGFKHLSVEKNGRPEYIDFREIYEQFGNSQ